jgi:hypothetical protein
VAAGARHRLVSGPAIRVTIAAMKLADAPRIAAVIAAASRGARGARTY